MLVEIWLNVLSMNIFYIYEIFISIYKYILHSITFFILLLNSFILINKGVIQMMLPVLLSVTCKTLLSSEYKVDGPKYDTSDFADARHYMTVNILR